MYVNEQAVKEILEKVNQLNLLQQQNMLMKKKLKN